MKENIKSCLVVKTWTPSNGKRRKVFILSVNTSNPESQPGFIGVIK